jgi:hypothetical protein
LPQAVGIIYVLMALAALLAAGMPALSAAHPSLDILRGLGVAGVVAALVWAYLGAALLLSRLAGIVLAALVPVAAAIAAAFFGHDLAPGFWPLAAMAPLQVLALVAASQTLQTLLPFSALLWAAYAAQLLLFVPALVAAQREAQAAKARALREATLVLPEEVTTLYERHPLRTLGLNTGQARTRAIVRRRDEMLALAASGVPLAEALPDFVQVAIGSPVVFDEAEIKRAVARLQQEPERCLEALSWFHLDNEPEAVLRALAAGDLAAARAAWQPRAGAGRGGGGVKGDCAAYNLAVLAHVQAIASEAQSAPPHAVSNDEIWRASHELWQRALQSAPAWSGIERLLAQCTDPRIGKDHLATLRRELPLRVLRVHRDLARAALRGNFTAYAKVQAERIAKSPLPEEARRQVLEELYATEIEQVRQALAPLHDRVRELTREGAEYESLRVAYAAARARLAALGALDRLEPLAREAIAEATDRLPRETFKPWRRCCDEDMDFYRGNTELIERWNRLSSQPGQYQIAMLREILGQMRSRGSLVATLETRLNEYAVLAERALRAAEALKATAQDARAEERDKFLKMLEDERKALEVRREEFRKSKEHHQRNVQGMANALGG